MIFNEISLKQQVPECKIKEQFSVFLKICQELKHKNNDNEFYYSDELMSDKFSDEYTVHNWLKDQSVPQKDRQFFRTLVQR